MSTDVSVRSTGMPIRRRRRYVLPISVFLFCFAVCVQQNSFCECVHVSGGRNSFSYILFVYTEQRKNTYPYSCVITLLHAIVCVCVCFLMWNVSIQYLKQCAPYVSHLWRLAGLSVSKCLMKCFKLLWETFPKLKHTVKESYYLNKHTHALPQPTSTILPRRSRPRVNAASFIFELVSRPFPIERAHIVPSRPLSSFALFYRSNLFPKC